MCILDALKPLIVVLERIDLFAARPRQSLLYTLFELARRPAAASTPLLVLGITTRTVYMSYTTSGKKFSHRKIHLKPSYP